MDFGEKRNPLCLTKLGCAKRMALSLFFLVWLLSVMCFPHTFRNLHVGKGCGEG